MKLRGRAKLACVRRPKHSRRANRRCARHDGTEWRRQDCSRRKPRPRHGRPWVDANAPRNLGIGDPRTDWDFLERLPYASLESSAANIKGKIQANPRRVDEPDYPSHQPDRPFRVHRKERTRGDGLDYPKARMRTSSELRVTAKMPRGLGGRRGWRPQIGKRRVAGTIEPIQQDRRLRHRGHRRRHRPSPEPSCTSDGCSWRTWRPPAGRAPTPVGIETCGRGMLPGWLTDLRARAKADWNRLVPLRARLRREPYRPAGARRRTRRALFILRTEVRTPQPLPARRRRLSQLHPIWLVNRCGRRCSQEIDQCLSRHCLMSAS